MKRLSPILRTPASSNVAFWAENEHAAFRNLGRAPDSGPVPGTAESQVAAVDPKEAEELQDQLNQVENQIKELEEIKNEILMRLSELGAQSAGSSSRGSKTTMVNPDTFAGREFPWSQELRQVLRQKFRIAGDFRPFQEDIINASLSGKDVVGILSTGSGKSLCYQLPAVLSQSRGLTLVISPLLSLIVDQVLELRNNNIEAVMMTSLSLKEDIKHIYEQLNMLVSGMSRNGPRLLYVTPERLASSKRVMSILEKLFKSNRLDRIVIDEAHCCSQYGHDFRKDYLKLGVLKMSFPTVPILALTATCPAFVLSNMMSILQLKSDKTVIYAGNLNRPNLFYTIQSKPAVLRDSVQLIVDWITEKHAGEKGIIYCLSQKDSEQVAQMINELSQGSIRCAVYHASVKDTYKTAVHEKWKGQSIHVVVATIAFGMGINNPEVRFVIHHSMSKSVEGYYQESGRAGRDGKPADCLLLFRGQDASRLTSLVYGETEGQRNVYGMIQYCNSVNICRRILLKRYFGTEAHAGSSSNPLDSVNQWKTANVNDDICNGHCDVCVNDKNKDIESKNIIKEVWTVCKILSVVRHQMDEKLTLNKLIEVWKGRSGTLKNKMAITTLKTIESDMMVFPVAKHIDLDNLERMVLQMLLEGFLKEEFHFTAYTTLSYLVLNSKGKRLISFNTLESLPRSLQNVEFFMVGTGDQPTPAKAATSSASSSKKRSASVVKSDVKRSAIGDERETPTCDEPIDLTADSDEDFDRICTTYGEDLPVEEESEGEWEFDI